MTPLVTELPERERTHTDFAIATLSRTRPEVAGIIKPSVVELPQVLERGETAIAEDVPLYTSRCDVPCKPDSNVEVVAA